MPVRSSPDGLHGRPVLVVDDDEAVLRTLRRLLERTCPVRTARTVEEALRAMGVEPEPCAAVFDVGLPDGNGLDLLATVRKRRPGLPALVLTVHNDTASINRAQQIGAEYACKPVSADCVRAFARRAAARQERGGDEAGARVADLGCRRGLTPREREILAMAVADRSRDEIRGLLGMADGTLRHHVASLLEKCGEESLADLARKIRAGARAR